MLKNKLKLALSLSGTILGGFLMGWTGYNAAVRQDINSDQPKAELHETVQGFKNDLVDEIDSYSYYHDLENANPDKFAALAYVKQTLDEETVEGMLKNEGKLDEFFRLAIVSEEKFDEDWADYIEWKNSRYNYRQDNYANLVNAIEINNRNAVEHSQFTVAAVASAAATGLFAAVAGLTLSQMKEQSKNKTTEQNETEA